MESLCLMLKSLAPGDSWKLNKASKHVTFQIPLKFKIKKTLIIVISALALKEGKNNIKKHLLHYNKCPVYYLENFFYLRYLSGSFVSYIFHQSKNTHQRTEHQSLPVPSWGLPSPWRLPDAVHFESRWGPANKPKTVNILILDSPQSKGWSAKMFWKWKGHYHGNYCIPHHIRCTTI